MMTYSLKQISDKSYILSEFGNRVAILTKNDQGITTIGKLPVKKFENWDIFEKYLGKSIEFEIDVEEENSDKEMLQISGLPVKHSVIFDIQENPTSYTKIQGSKIRFAAGFFGIKFEHGWTASFCPKLSTLESCEYIGPFTSKLEMSNAITNHKNRPVI